MSVELLAARTGADAAAAQPVQQVAPQSSHLRASNAHAE